MNKNTERVQRCSAPVFVCLMTELFCQISPNNEDITNTWTFKMISNLRELCLQKYYITFSQVTYP